MTHKLSALLVALLLLINQSLCFASEKQPSAFEGAWKINRLVFKTADKEMTIDKPDIGRFIFTDQFYALIYSPTQQPRTAFKNLSQPEEQEILAGFRSIVFNSGRYSASDSVLHLTADIAKVPGFESGQQFYRFEFKDNQLQLEFFDETYPNGDKPSWQGKMTLHILLERQ